MVSYMESGHSALLLDGAVKAACKLGGSPGYLVVTVPQGSEAVEAMGFPVKLIENSGHGGTRDAVGRFNE